MRIDLGKIPKRLKKLKGKRFISFLLLLLMLGSTITGFALQAFTTGNRPVTEEPVELPDTNMVDYALTAEQRDLLIRQGKTVMEYRYQIGCEDCRLERAYLSSFVNELSPQLFLQEIVDGSAAQSRLEMSSFYGRQVLTEPTADDMFEALCAVMADPPVRCVTMGL
jgi:hypothetical protein